MISQDAKLVTSDLLCSLRPQFDSLSSEFVYLFSLNKIASYHTRMSPDAIPIFWDYVFHNRRILTDKEALILFQWSINVPPALKEISENLIVLARLQNFFVAVMREIDVCYKLKQIDSSCKIYKSYRDDMAEGRVDIYCENSAGKTLAFAVAHDGAFSEWHDKRKVKKQAKEVLTLTASYQRENKSIHFVSKNDIGKFFDV